MSSNAWIYPGSGATSDNKHSTNEEKNQEDENPETGILSVSNGHKEACPAVDTTPCEEEMMVGYLPN